MGSVPPQKNRNSEKLKHEVFLHMNFLVYDRHLRYYQMLCVDTTCTCTCSTVSENRLIYSHSMHTKATCVTFSEVYMYCIHVHMYMYCIHVCVHVYWVTFAWQNYELSLLFPLSTGIPPSLPFVSLASLLSFFFLSL